VRSNVTIAVSGSHNFGAFGGYAVTGKASITSMLLPSNPIIPSNPIGVLTIATLARAINGVNTCSFTGATTVTVPADATSTVDAVVFPSNPIVPGNPLNAVEPCAPPGSFAIRYSVSISSDNTITGVTAQTQPSVDLPT
jgi:hypothetical protein